MVIPDRLAALLFVFSLLAIYSTSACPPQTLIEKAGRFNKQRISILPYDLAIGASHEGVQEAKKYLKQFDYVDSGTFIINDTFDLSTSDALRRFQVAFTLNETGHFDGPTKAALTMARCAHGEPNSLAASGISKWNKKELTYSFSILSRDLPGAVCKAAVRRAFETWQNAGVGLSFTEVVGTTPDIMVGWRDALDEDYLKLETFSMQGSTIAHADFPGTASVIVKKGTPPLPLHFDDEEHIWADGTFSNAYDIESVALHEIGHTLGLLHSTDQSAVMFPSISHGKTKRRLEPDDLAGIRSLYGAT